MTLIANTLFLLQIMRVSRESCILMRFFPGIILRFPTFLLSKQAEKAVFLHLGFEGAEGTLYMLMSHEKNYNFWHQQVGFRAFSTLFCFVWLSPSDLKGKLITGLFMVCCDLPRVGEKALFFIRWRRSIVFFISISIRRKFDSRLSSSISNNEMNRKENFPNRDFEAFLILTHIYLSPETRSTFSSNW